EEAVLGGERHRIRGLTVVLHRHQLRGGIWVVIPNVVMNGLVVPEVFTRAGVQREEAIGIKIVAWPIAAVELVLRGGYREVGDSVLLIDGDLAPDIHAAHVFVGIFRPRVVSEFARTRNRMEHPQKLAADYIEGANISRRRQVSLSC